MANDSNTVFVTRKIQLFIHSDNREEKKVFYQKLFYWQNIIFRGANMVMSHLFIQEQMKDLLYLQDEVKVKLADRNKDDEGILNTSKTNATYRVLSHYFKGCIHTDILSKLNTSLLKTFNAERKDYWKGMKSLRNYKKNIPIPFSGHLLKLNRSEVSKDFHFTLFNIPFRTYLGKDRSDKRVLLQRTLVGQIKICASAIQLIKGKIFLLLTLQLPKKEVKLEHHIIAEASLSIAHPITVQIEKDYYQIGNEEEFLHRRLAIQVAKRRLQRAINYNNAAHGRKKQRKCLKYYSSKEKDYVESKLHLYSRQLIDICVKAQAGTLLLVNQSYKEEVAKDDPFILRNWSYFGLIEKIKYKANMVGINVIVE